MKKAAASPSPNPAVEAYIEAVPEPHRAALRELRSIIRSALPAAALEVISYRIPAFALPKPFFGYAAFKHHLAVIPFSGSFLERFASDLEGFSRTKSSLHLPYDQPLPAALIRRLARGRAAELRVTDQVTPPKPRAGHRP